LAGIGAGAGSLLTDEQLLELCAAVAVPVPTD
jgi:hypothetical protein